MKKLIILAVFFLSSNLNAAELWTVEELKTKIDQSGETLVLIDVRTK